MAWLNDTLKTNAWVLLTGLYCNAAGYEEAARRFPGIVRCLERRGEAWVRGTTLKLLRPFLPAFTDPAAFPKRVVNPVNYH